MVAFSVCNVAWHVVATYWLAKYVGTAGWLLLVPVGVYYALVGAIVSLAFSSIRSFSVKIKLQSETLSRVWEAVKGSKNVG